MAAVQYQRLLCRCQHVCVLTDLDGALSVPFGLDNLFYRYVHTMTSAIYATAHPTKKRKSNAKLWRQREPNETHDFGGIGVAGPKCAYRRDIIP